MRLISWSVPVPPDRRAPTLEEAHRRMKRIEHEAQEVIKILTVEQALLAQRIVREAGTHRNGTRDGHR